MTISDNARRRLKAALCDATAGEELATLLDLTDDLNHTAEELDNMHDLVEDMVDDITLSVGTEDGNSGIAITGQLKDVSGDSLEEIRNVHVFLSDANSGIDLTGTAPDGGVAGTAGKIISSALAAANTVFLVQTNASGAFILTLTDSGTPTFYLVAVLPSGQQVVSDAITFAT